MHIRSFAIALLLASLALTPHADARKAKSDISNPAVASEVSHTRSTTMQAAGTLEAAFSPNGGSEALVVRVIESAREELLVMAYSFTSIEITRALVNAQKRGVAVYVVADAKNNLTEDRTGKARAALSALANAGVDVRMISYFAIAHDKVIIVDRQTTEFGSYNYTTSAAKYNSENVFVNWNNPELANLYALHFVRNQKLATPFVPN